VETDASTAVPLKRSLEVEAKLLVVVRPVAALWTVLEALRELDGFTLDPLADQHLSDRYFDTADHALRQADLALRLRDDDTNCAIAVKGKSRMVGHVASRFEVERPCSRESIDEVLALLRGHGVALAVPADTAAATGPADILARAGLQAWQSRTTQRQRRAIRRTDEPVAIAELALDDCRYRHDGGWIRHYEIEIESTRGDANEVGRLLSMLHARYAGKLRPWPHSKLATGAALAAFAKAQGLTGIVDENTTVRADLYAEIERWLTVHAHP